ncbi:CGNR zinc finger domain-containing protein [Actinomycetospora endophytica]|uniref:CGNR zinc finger domain-containing protein n=1 Tax=Actinomycetospora endophytica TaxID=2291215 RepID=A0ABS8PB84_9PSEU|nr:ABATE domain-containing protein [Actinomycetospora endophytica]MCD2195394.1 CGNR zinc finger domain-containing protein [Actinomycetospora endophytica]
MDEQAPEHPFVFLGGDVALDFVNTVLVDGGAPVDRLPAPADLAGWVAASGLGEEFGVPDRIAPTVHATAIALRGALKAGFDAVVTGEPVPDEAVASLNAVLRTGPGSELRGLPGDDLRLRPAVDLTADATALPWLLADAGARLLVGDRARLLRRCANHDTCVLMFLDTSRSHTRRWCSMDLCGNRSKVAAHGARARRRQQP